MFIPAKVSAKYFNGRKKRYPYPVQFFFIVMFLFLLVFSRKIEGAPLNSTNGNFNVRIGGEDSLMNRHLADVLAQKGFFELLQQYDRAKRLREEVSTLPSKWQTPEVKLAVDSLIQKVDGKVLKNRAIFCGAFYFHHAPAVGRFFNPYASFGAERFRGQPGMTGHPVIAWIGLSLLLAMKRFFRESWIWTIAKWILFSALYLIGLLAVFIVTLLVVFVIF